MLYALLQIATRRSVNNYTTEAVSLRFLPLGLPKDFIALIPIPA